MANNEYSFDDNSYNEAYAVLEKISSELENEARAGEGTPDIDGLIPKVEAAGRAYKSCKARLDAVDKALEEHLKQFENAEGVAGDDSLGEADNSIPGEPFVSENDPENDIPF